MSLSNSAKIESILLFKNEPVSLKWLAKTTKLSEEQVEQALETLKSELSERGVALQRKDEQIRLSTHPEMAETIEELTREELSRDLGKAGLETLSIIIYAGPIARSELDYIRGVNSQFILRNLLVRGLVERVTSPNDKRSFLYRPTFDLLSHLGLTNVKEMPEYEAVKAEIAAINEQAKQSDSEEEQNDEPNEENNGSDE